MLQFNSLLRLAARVLTQLVDHVPKLLDADLWHADLGHAGQEAFHGINQLRDRDSGGHGAVPHPHAHVQSKLVC